MKVLCLIRGENCGNIFLGQIHSAYYIGKLVSHSQGSLRTTVTALRRLVHWLVIRLMDKTCAS